MPSHCTVCKKPPRYKCAACRAEYCSVGCYKVHRDECNGGDSEKSFAQDHIKPDPDPEEISPPPKDLVYPSPSTVTVDPDLPTLSREKLEMLVNSTALRQQLSDPTIQEMLRNIEQTLQQEEDAKKNQLEATGSEVTRLKLQQLNWSSGTKAADLMTKMRENDPAFAKLTSTIMDLVQESP